MENNMYTKEEEICLDIGEFCNRVVTDQDGTRVYLDKQDIRSVIELLEVVDNG